VRRILTCVPACLVATPLREGGNSKQVGESRPCPPTAVQSGTYILPLAILAAFQGYKSFTEYQRQKREKPAFFLWKVLRGSHRASPPGPKGQRRLRGRRIYPGRS
jgi:hypothetical protein